MSTTQSDEEIKQKRREKILARISSEQQAAALENAEQQPVAAAQPAQSTAPPTSTFVSVFERYRLLKVKEKNQQILSLISKTVGILIVLLGLVLPPETVFLTVWTCLTLAALYITRESASGQSEVNELDWIVKLVPLIGKLKNIERVIFVAGIGLNVLLSYLVSAVLLNSFWISIQRLNASQL